MKKIFTEMFLPYKHPHRSYQEARREIATQIAASLMVNFNTREWIIDAAGRRGHFQLVSMHAVELANVLLEELAVK